MLRVHDDLAVPGDAGAVVVEFGASVAALGEAPASRADGATVAPLAESSGFGVVGEGRLISTMRMRFDRRMGTGESNSEWLSSIDALRFPAGSLRLPGSFHSALLSINLIAPLPTPSPLA
jgi:hypothetical protein